MSETASMFMYLGVLFFLGILFLLLGVFRRRKTNNWKRTDGSITGPIQKKLIEFNYDEYVSFQYQVNGVVYEKTSNIKQNPPPKPGKRIKVLYNPDHPKEAIMDTFVQNGGLFRVIGGFFIAGGVIATVVLGLL